ncbi:MAG: hypothetical protein J5687_09130 [Treponema sp.]|nr:hypothetical protein [Treponema sp.]
MKKTLIFMFSVMAFLFISCQNASNSITQEPETPAEDTSTETGTNDGGLPITIGDDGTVIIGARSLVSLGEGTEEIDSVSYTVKKYADVYVESPYFYTYYKLYYLNNKLRRVYSYHHGFQCDMDYTYTEFVEHLCGYGREDEKEPIHEIYTYFENGKKESYYYDFYEDGKLYGEERKYDLNGHEIGSKYYDKDGVPRETKKEYDSNGNLISEKYYVNNVLENEYSYEYEYYTNGSRKTYKRYENGILKSETEYYESGKQKISRYYQNGYLQNEWEYYENGSQKSSKNYNHNILCYESLYYQGTSPGLQGQTKANIQYNNNTGILTSFTSYYSSGYLKSIYWASNGILYTFEDEKYLTQPSNFEGPGITQTTLTEEQGLAKLEELRNSN